MRMRTWCQARRYTETTSQDRQCHSQTRQPVCGPGCAWSVRLVENPQVASQTGWIGPIGPLRKIRKVYQVLHFSGPRKNWPEIAPNGARRIFFLLIWTLATFWATRILILISLFFLFFLGSKISRFPGPRFPNFQKSGLARLGPTLGPLCLLYVCSSCFMSAPTLLLRPLVTNKHMA